MGNPEDDGQSPQERKTLLQRYKDRVQKATALREQSAAKRQAKFEASALGKWWIPIRTRITAKRGGRIAFGATKVVAYLALLFLIRPVILDPLFAVMFPADYQLTDVQKKQGYDFTCGGRYCTNDDVAYRFLTQAEANSDPSCKQSWDYCVYAIPVYNDCQEIYMEFHTTKDSGMFSATIESPTATIRPGFGKNFKAGSVNTIGVSTPKAASRYGQVDRIYCRTP